MPTRLGLVIMLSLWLSAAAPSTALADGGGDGTDRVGSTTGPGAPAAGHGVAVRGSSDPDDWIRRGGRCGNSDVRWNLRIILSPGAFDVGIRIVSDAPDQVWDWEMRHDGQNSYDGRRQTRDETGAFTVFRDMSDRIGTDWVGMKATMRSGAGDVICKPFVKVQG